MWFPLTKLARILNQNKLGLAPDPPVGVVSSRICESSKKRKRGALQLKKERERWEPLFKWIYDYGKSVCFDRISLALFRRSVKVAPEDLTKLGDFEGPLGGGLAPNGPGILRHFKSIKKLFQKFNLFYLNVEIPKINQHKLMWKFNINRTYDSVQCRQFWKLLEVKNLCKLKREKIVFQWKQRPLEIFIISGEFFDLFENNIF